MEKKGIDILNELLYDNETSISFLKKYYDVTEDLLKLYKFRFMLFPDGEKYYYLYNSELIDKYIPMFVPKGISPFLSKDKTFLCYFVEEKIFYLVREDDKYKTWKKIDVDGDKIITCKQILVSNLSNIDKIITKYNEICQKYLDMFLQIKKFKKLCNRKRYKPSKNIFKKLWLKICRMIYVGEFLKLEFFIQQNVHHDFTEFERTIEYNVTSKISSFIKYMFGENSEVYLF